MNRGQRGRNLITSRARTHGDRAGDPLDGLVNLFDLGIVLAVGFLLAALSSLDAADVLTNRGEVAVVRRAGPQEVTAGRGQQVRPADPRGRRVVGRGARVGSVYRLSDGRLVYVTGR